MSKNFFEKHPKFILLIINAIFLALVIFIFRLDLFQDAPGKEKYSLIDRIEYQIRCQGKRNIVLRENKPNRDEFRIPPYDPEAKYSFRTDENGFVKPGKIHKNPDLNIFFVGGSTTECETVKELERFPYLSGRLLEEKTGKKINSYNAARSGNDTLHSLNIILNKIAPFNPDIIVRMENVNDLSALLYESTFWNRNKSRSSLGCFTKKMSSMRNMRNEWEESPYVNMILNEAHQQRIKNEYRKILKMFISMTRSVGAMPVLMTQANRIENNPDFSIGRGSKKFNETYRQLYIDFHNIVRKVAKEENVFLIDLAKEVEGSKTYIYDAVHFNNDGSKLVSEIIARELSPII